MWFKKAFSIVFLVLMMALSGPAQSNLCLYECLAYAWENNLELILYGNDLGKSKLRLSQAGREFLPSLSAEHHHFISTGRSLNLENYSRENEDIQQGNIAINTELYLFQGLSRLCNLKMAATSIHLADLELRKQKWLLGTEIIRCYYSILLNQTDLEVLESNRNLTRQEINKLEQLIASGSKPGSEIYEMQAQECQETIQYERLLLDRNRKNNELEKLINWKETESLQVSTCNDLTKPRSEGKISLQHIYAELQNSLLLNIEEESIHLSQLDIRKQKSDYLPRISAQGLLSSHYLRGAMSLDSENPEYRYPEQIQDNYVLQLGFSIAIPLYDKGRSHTSIMLKKLEIEDAKLHRELVKKNLEQTLYLLVSEIESLARRIHESQKLCHSLKQTWKAAREKYDAGLLDAFSLNLIRNKHLQAQLNLNRLQTEYGMNVELLGFYERYGKVGDRQK